MKQEEALKILKSGKNVFLTGIAGAGKTYVLGQYIDYLRKNDIPVAVTASTGIVAAALDGRTIHSFSGLGIRENLSEEDYLKIKFNKALAKRIKHINVLIIDEISMLSGEQLDLVDKIFRKVRDKNVSFGGVQVVFCGDFLQLPPVRNSSNFAFKSMAWFESDPVICYLDKTFRQEDNDLLEVLNAIRSSNVTDEIISRVHAQINSTIENFTTLFTHNVDVDIFNKNELEKIKEKSHFYRMSTQGNPDVAQTIMKNCLSPELLELKPGAKVMVTRNNNQLGVVNGTIATVVKCSKLSVTIRLATGRTLDLEEATWSILDEGGKTIASIHQIPLRLAYAITVHKSQGMTLNAASMDLSKVFVAGQGYVAFSRLRSLKNLSLEGPVNPQAFMVNQECLEFEQEIIEKSRKTILPIDKPCPSV